MTTLFTTTLFNGIFWCIFSLFYFSHYLHLWYVFIYNFSHYHLFQILNKCIPIIKLVIRNFELAGTLMMKQVNGDGTCDERFSSPIPCSQQSPPCSTFCKQRYGQHVVRSRCDDEGQGQFTCICTINVPCHPST